MTEANEQHFRQASTTNSSSESVPLVVDLDGTLTPSDTLYESLLLLTRKRPWDLFLMPGWWRQGRAHLKARLATRVHPNPTLLPYDQTVLARINQAREEGRKVILATASDRYVAAQVAGHLKCFDQVMASDGQQNLSGQVKAAKLVDAFGAEGFDYIANDHVDRPVWAKARKAILHNAPDALVRDMRLTENAGRIEISAGATPQWRELLKTARPYQWVKNLLLFVPAAAAQQFDSGSQFTLLIAFLLFSLVASAIYLVNDMLDIEADRTHPRKHSRAFAAAKLSLKTGVFAVALALVVAFVGAFLLSVQFAAILALYLLVTSLYSLFIKRFPLIDVVSLAGLYTLRIIAGGVAVGLDLSLWLLAFSMFLFTSLAFAKRFTEVVELIELEKQQAGGRGYRTEDRQTLMSLGTASGMASILTLALYVNSAAATGTYSAPALLWGVCPILLYWVSRVWWAAQRGYLSDDPIVYAFQDKVSWIMAALLLVPILAATWW